MEKLYVETLAEKLKYNCARLGIIAFLSVFLCLIGTKAIGNVTITAGTGGTSICNTKAVGGSAPAFTTLGTITINEGNIADINGGSGGITNVLILNAPAGWQFNAVLPSITYTTGANITAVSGSISSTTLTVNITATNTNALDQVYISGLQVQATSTSSAAGYIYASSVTGIAGITAGTSGTNFGSLSLTVPVTPAVSIAASPSGAVCPGMNVTFIPTPVNGGSSPAYQWTLNGISVATGSTYSSSSLATGNTLYCTMTTAATCITASTAVSNTITMTVNPAPAAIAGSNITCPGNTTTLTDATTGGMWSSSSGGIAVVGSATGVVSGIAPGTATISYTASGCSATTMVYVNSLPLAPVLTPTLTTICNGSGFAITSTGTSAPSTILTQNFNSGITPWTVDNTGSVGTVSGAEWKACGDGYINEQGLYHSPDSTTFAMSNSDTSGSSSYTSSKLISPTFSLAGYCAATLTFQHSYQYWPAGDFNANLEISTDGGSTWNTIRNFVGANIGTKTSFGTETFSLNTYLGQTNVRIRFYYYCHWGYYWAIDNVSITGISSVVIPTWSPSSYLYIDSTFSTAYTSGTAVNIVYVHPTTVTTPTPINYVASATIPGCSTSSSSAVTINPTPVAISGAGNVCVGSVTTLTDATGGGTWSSSNTSIATIGSVNGVVTGVSAGTATISYISGSSCMATMVITVNITPAPIGGTASVCISSSVTLTEATSGGTWSSNNTSIAAIGSSTGIVTGVATGTSTITYSLGLGCTAIKVVTVNPLPSAITGTTNVCNGLTTTLSDVTSGGAWSSSNTATASIGSANGVVTGNAAGTVTITYTLGTGCFAATPVTVNPMEAITGTVVVCMGQTTVLYNSVPGGVWSSGSSVASVGSASGVVTGINAGTGNIFYILPTGCTSVKSVTVNPLPATISGASGVCKGLTTTYTDATTGGTWSSSDTTLVTIGSSSGIVTGVNPGVAIITYSLPTGCIASSYITVNPLSPITGTTTVCAGLTTSLSNVNTGGVWSSSNLSVGTVNSTTGVVTGISAGTAIITYNLPTTACAATTTVTVNPLPATITGTTNVCFGLTTTLSDATPGGTWSSGNGIIATVGSVSGVVSGSSTGTVTITYTLPTSCLISTPFTVNPLPTTIAGGNNVCVNSTITLNDATAGGTWSSDNISIATAGSATGIITGVLAGTANITYTLPTGCIATKTITVNSLPAAISGTPSVCMGLTVALGDATSGGTWSSSNTAVATIGSMTGVVSGITAGTATVTYMLATGCIATTTVTVNPLPSAITGTAAVCMGLTTTLNDASVSGTWSCASAYASVGSTTGIVNGISPGTATVTYTLPTSCIATKVVTVNPLPSAIAGTLSVCVGLTTSLNDATSGGTWNSGNTSVATIGSGSGAVSGIVTGTSVITYTLPTSCIAVATITVNPLPAPITGSTSICAGATTTLISATSGGTWGSSNTGVATIGSASGITNGIAAGNTIITYTLVTGCNTMSAFSVNPLPAAIGGATYVCQGATAALTDATGGGSWSSSNTSLATIGSGTGVASGIATGTLTITYTLPTGCTATRTFTVNQTPSPITGASNLCQGVTSTFSDATSGGTWSSSNITVAIIGSTSGALTSLSAGTTVISYTLSGLCSATSLLTVNLTPAAISGTMSVCAGFTTALADATAGGTWVSGNTAIALVGSASGIVSGISAGTATISYTMSSGCFTSATVTINASPAAISGSTSICLGATTLLSDAVTGGSWSSSNTSVATIGSSSGLVIGFATGTTTISYSLNGCTVTAVLTVNPLPAAITGPTNVCQGLTITLSDAVPGGTWSSSSTTVATVGSGNGVVSGVASGAATIIYTLPTGCTASKSVSVNPAPSPITGTMNVCQGLTTSLSDATTGGTWSSGNTSIATIGSATGIVTGVAPGTAQITYTPATGCTITAIVTVNPVPAPVTGSLIFCSNASTTLSDATPGGTWISGNTSVATAGSATGIVSGVSGGTAVISYSLSMGCTSVTTVTVNPVPAAITGVTSICFGLNTTLSDATGGGVWTSTSPSVATVGSASGVVTAVSTGTTTISYTLATGCAATATILVNTVTPITGPSNVCAGAIASLSNASTGGTWSSSNSAIFTVGSATGIVTGVAAGTAIVTYTLGTGCLTTSTITVYAAPSPITGILSVCPGATTALSDASGGGTWSSGSISIATIGSGSGVVSGVTPGTAVISYIVTSTGCIATTIVTVNTPPSAITGSANVCLGSTTALSDATTGGTWSSSTPSVATIGSASGLVIGFTVGTTIITYTAATGCITTAVVTVNPLPPTISGASSVCQGATITLSDATTGGTWSSSNTSIATIGSASGIVTGATGGVVTITYTLPTGCITTKSITVNTLPSPITGTLSVCAGYTTTLSNSTSGGVWSSSNISIATIGSVSGVVSGLVTGTSIVTYTPATGCITTAIVTVNAMPAPITGASSTCAGAAITLSDVSVSGTWSSSNPGVATIGSATGIVTGVAAGTVNITYSLVAGCFVTVAVTINSLPAAITGTTNICSGWTVTLADATTGGIWSSSNATVVNIGSASGVVTGATTGTAIITYQLGTGCIAITTVTVNALPSAITGIPNVCVGAATSLTSSPSGGTWSSSNISIASVGTLTGIVSGGAAGTALMSYTIYPGCVSSATVTVNPLPAPVTGILSLCAGLTTTLSDAIAGGAWSSSNPAIATIGSSTGIVNGIAAGTSIITYLLGTGCMATATVTVNLLPAPITGTLGICTGLTTTLSDAASGGVWSSGNITVAIIGSASGIVTGIAIGTASITYTNSFGCIAIAVVTVNLSPAPITGVSNVCAGFAATLSNSVSGGTWTSSSPSLATIGSATGVVNGVAAGIVTIYYSLGAGCFSTKLFTVNPLPSSITGIPALCQSLTTTLSDATAGGTWTSAAPSIAAIGSTTGIVTGVSTGTAIITYTLPTGCYTTIVVTVNALTSITGVTNVCVASAIILSNTTAGGTWSSGATGIATIGSVSGIINGISAGTAIISYSYGAGCYVTAIVTVNPLPSTITGTANVCVGLTTTLNDATTGGTWSSDAAGIATIGSANGVVTGISAGTASITYMLSTGCLTSTVITVNPLPSSITGITQVCAGLTTMLSDATTGGIWSSGSSGTVSVGSTTGIATGIVAGTANITYTLATGCIATTTVTVNPLPAMITGVAAVCAGLATTLYDATSGGTWSSSNTSIATIGTGGIVAGIAAGTSTVTYALPTGCIKTAVVTVNPLPASISGANNVCAGSTTSLTDATTGGTWSAGSGIVTIGSSSGIVTGLSAGTAYITYLLSTGCIATTLVTVNPVPAGISGVTHVCAGLTTNLSDATPGGAWGSSATGTASVGTTGVVTGMSAGIATITYSLPTGCFTTIPFTVNPVPADITGTFTLCTGLSTTLSDATSGGTWSSGAPAIATIGSTGVVSGLAAGTSNITYSLPTGCIATIILTVYVSPASITGAPVVCTGFTTTLSNATTGGAWSSGSTSIAAVGSATGIVSGISSGSAIITYALGSGCKTTINITVNSVPAVITGASTLCTGLSTTLSDATAGGAWSSGASAIASIGSSGIVSGISAGIASITYVLSTGCYAATMLTVYASPASITGAPTVCYGATTSLTNATTGGIWNSSNPIIANIGSASGVVTGLSPGTALITYTLSSGCNTTTTITVNPLPAAIAGANNVCVGATTSLTDPAAGGAWASSNTGIATVAVTGIVSGISAGAAFITYTLPTGCATVMAITVNPLPATITGATTVCQGSIISLSNATTGGVWSSGTPGTAVIGSSTGIVSGVSGGTSVITYMLSTGCIATKPVTVNPLLPITGSGNACLGLTMALSDGVTGGTWSSGAPLVASIGSATGIVNGLSLGTATITYTLPTGCAAIKNITVNPVPVAITGASNVCQGYSTLLSDATPGGTWSSGVPGIATVVSGTGAVMGVSAGTALITYMLSTGCNATTVFTVNPLFPITGSINLCAGSISTLSDAATGGTWSSSNASVATINATTGVVTANATGTTMINYLLTTGCNASVIITVNASPVVYAVTGGGSFCTGGAGVPVGLNSSDTGFTYKLYNGTAFISSLAGTGASLNYGLQTMGGVYTVLATNASSGCSRSMSGSATVVVLPLTAPSITIASATGDTACAGAVTTYTAIAAYGGSSPAYLWRVNGASVSTSNIYGYVPSGGDIVSCTLTSSAACALPDTAIASLVVTIAPVVMPSVSVSVSPGDVVCEFTTVTATPYPAYGGSSPFYTWYKNGANVGVSPAYIFTPANGDDIYCVLHSNQTCRLMDTVAGGYDTFSVVAAVTPSVTITANPGLSIMTGQSDTLTAMVTGGGPSPAYQWKINGVSIPSATSPVFVWSSFANMDSVSCEVTSSGLCSGVVGSAFVFLKLYNVGVQQVITGSDFTLTPNPNNGEFTLSGKANSELSVEVTDLLGQIVYTGNVLPRNGKINERIKLSNTLANGTYLLNIHSSEGNRVFHFVISE